MSRAPAHRVWHTYRHLEFVTSTSEQGLSSTIGEEREDNRVSSNNRGRCAPVIRLKAHVSRGAAARGDARTCHEAEVIGIPREVQLGLRLVVKASHPFDAHVRPRLGLLGFAIGISLLLY